MFIFEKPRSACDIIEKPRSISVRLMTINAIVEHLHLLIVLSTVVILTKQVHSLFKIFGLWTAPTSVRVIVKFQVQVQ